MIYSVARDTLYSGKKSWKVGRDPGFDVLVSFWFVSLFSLGRFSVVWYWYLYVLDACEIAKIGWEGMQMYWGSVAERKAVECAGST